MFSHGFENNRKSTNGKMLKQLQDIFIIIIRPERK